MVLYAGSFNAAYGIPALLAAAEKSHATWVFAGNGAARALIETANVYYLGSVPRSELFPALLAADVGINARATWPLLDTTITGKLFDYMAAGVPVVSLRDGQIGEIIRAARCGVVTRDLAGGIETVLAQPEMGPAGREWLRARMHAGTMARRAAKAILQVKPHGLLRHLPGALADTMRNRSPKALHTAYGADRQAVLHKAFGDWPTSFPEGPLKIPALLG